MPEYYFFIFYSLETQYFQLRYLFIKLTPANVLPDIFKLFCYYQVDEAQPNPNSTQYLVSTPALILASTPKLQLQLQLRLWAPTLDDSGGLCVCAALLLCLSLPSSSASSLITMWGVGLGTTPKGQLGGTGTRAGDRQMGGSLKHFSFDCLSAAAGASSLTMGEKQQVLLFFFRRLSFGLFNS